MFLRILKKDLKRKKTMNLIILLFVILSTMFFASSVNNIFSIAGGIDRFMDMSGMKDYVALFSEPESGQPLGDMLNGREGISEWERETVIYCNSDTTKYNGSRLEGFTNFGAIVSADDVIIKCFDKNNEPLTDVEKGKVYITSTLVRKMGMKEGDRIAFDMCGEKLELEYAGICKDGITGGEMVDCPRFIINPGDFSTLYNNDEIRATRRYGIYIIGADDIKDIEEVLGSVNGCRFKASRAMIRTTHFVNILIAGIVMTVSIFLIIISFVVLRFTIGFTITEEFREIGVMKAIGLKNSSIRGLYLAKYFGIAVIGAAAGFFAAIPFGRLLLDSVSSDMVLGNDHPVLIGSVCSAFVVGTIVLFCWSCTARIKKLSPIDAVRNGQTGERFRKHSVLGLGKSRLGTSGFISLNDIVSSPKQSAILTAVFTLCMLLVMVLANTAETLASDKLMYLTSVTDSDAYITMNDKLEAIEYNGKTLDDICNEIEDDLAKNDMPGSVFVEGMYNVRTEYKGKTAAARFLYCGDTNTTDYYYNEGTAPQYANETALALPLAKELGAEIGDKVRLTMSGEEKEYIVTALFDSFNNLGMCGRLHESAEPPIGALAATMAYQIDFDDSPDAKTIDERVERLKKIYNTKTAFNEAEYVADCTKASDAIMSAKNLTMAVTLIIIIMVSVLLERSFISKERSEIALMKAIGFKSRSVVGIHMLRFMLIAAISIIIAAAVSDPATKFIMDPIFSLMGILNGIEYAHDHLANFVILPAAVFAAVTAGTFFTALYTGSIKASDTSNIE